MNNILKINTVFSNPVEKIEKIDTPAIQYLNKATVYGTGSITDVNGFVSLNNMRNIKIETKPPYYIFIYTTYRGDVTDTPDTSAYVSDTRCDSMSLGSADFDCTELTVKAPEGCYIMVQIIKNPQEHIPEGSITIDDVVVMN